MERLLLANKAFFFSKKKKNSWNFIAEVQNIALVSKFFSNLKETQKGTCILLYRYFEKWTLCLASPSNERMVCTEIKSILIKKKSTLISYRINAGSKAREFKALYYTVPMSVLPTLMILLWAYCHLKNFPDRKLQAQQLCTRRLLIFPRTIHLCGYLTSSFIT